MKEELIVYVSSAFSNKRLPYEWNLEYGKYQPVSKTWRFTGSGN